MSRDAILFQTHFFDAVAARLFRKLQAGCPPGSTAFALVHVPPGTPEPPLLRRVPHHFVTTPEVRDSAYTNKSVGWPASRIYAEGHVDLPVLHFYRQHPDFDYYWIIEYDMRFSGSWSVFFREFEGDATDFLTTSVRSAASYPDWGLWKTLQRPPSDARPMPSGEDRIGCFMPIYRASRRAMERMDQAYREGWTGHCEVAWPTILHAAGFSVGDIGGDGEFVRSSRRGLFYNNTPHSPTMAPGTLVFRPLRYVPGLRRNLLWHPVKPPQIALREKYWEASRKWLQAQHRWRDRIRSALGRA